MSDEYTKGKMFCSSGMTFCGRTRSIDMSIGDSFTFKLSKELFTDGHRDVEIQKELDANARRIVKCWNIFNSLESTDINDLLAFVKHRNAIAATPNAAEDLPSRRAARGEGKA